MWLIISCIRRCSILSTAFRSCSSSCPVQGMCAQLWIALLIVVLQLLIRNLGFDLCFFCMFHKSVVCGCVWFCVLCSLSMTNFVHTCRHRLPRVDLTTHLMTYSAFPCEAHEYRLFKVRATDTECPNCTLICLVLRVTGPLSERDLCVVLLALQSLCSVFVFLLKYVVLAR